MEEDGHEGSSGHESSTSEMEEDGDSDAETDAAEAAAAVLRMAIRRRKLLRRLKAIKDAGDAIDVMIRKVEKRRRMFQPVFGWLQRARDKLQLKQEEQFAKAEKKISALRLNRLSEALREGSVSDLEEITQDLAEVLNPAHNTEAGLFVTMVTTVLKKTVDIKTNAPQDTSDEFDLHAAAAAQGILNEVVDDVPDNLAKLLYMLYEMDPEDPFTDVQKRRIDGLEFAFRLLEAPSRVLKTQRNAMWSKLLENKEIRYPLPGAFTLVDMSPDDLEEVRLLVVALEVDDHSVYAGIKTWLRRQPDITNPSPLTRLIVLLRREIEQRVPLPTTDALASELSPAKGQLAERVLRLWKLLREPVSEDGVKALLRKYTFESFQIVSDVLLGGVLALDVDSRAVSRVSPYKTTNIAFSLTRLLDGFAGIAGILNQKDQDFVMEVLDQARLIVTLFAYVKRLSAVAAVVTALLAQLEDAVQKTAKALGDVEWTVDGFKKFLHEAREEITRLAPTPETEEAKEKRKSDLKDFSSRINARLEAADEETEMHLLEGYVILRASIALRGTVVVLPEGTLPTFDEEQMKLLHAKIAEAGTVERNEGFKVDAYLSQFLVQGEDYWLAKEGEPLPKLPPKSSVDAVDSLIGVALQGLARRAADTLSWSLPLLLEAYRRRTAVPPEILSEETEKALANSFADLLPLGALLSSAQAKLAARSDDETAVLKTVELTSEYPDTVAIDGKVGNLALALYAHETYGELFTF